jgi:eukaryotic-like serine/threonine-protein kinase
MSDLLRPGQVVETQSGTRCEVEKFLGGGGQGEVYRAKWDGRPYALKWYYPASGTDEQRKALETLISKKGGAPSARFLWPLELAHSKAIPAYGYFMQLRPAQFKSLYDLMLGTVDPAYRTLVTASLQLVDSYRRLHGDGLCYKDISFGNAFFDPDTGDVLICDNDNVRVNGTPVTDVLGTPAFMAPEIVRQEAVPSRQTDLFSLAVLLFYIFHTNHPLAGKKIIAIKAFDVHAQSKLYGSEPLFIFDPDDHSNEAVDAAADPLREAGANALETWPIFPQFHRDLFTKAFTSGLRDPDHGRVTEGEWSGALSRLRDSIFYCGCGMENFYDPEAMKASGGRPKSCWSCQKEPRLPYRMRIGKSIVMLNHDTCLHAHHFDEQQSYDFTRVVAEVVQHPSNPALWGLKNCGNEKWVATMPDGSLRDVEPARSVPLATNTKVNFGKVEGEIRY